jgi:hypothetical protein
MLPRALGKSITGGLKMSSEEGIHRPGGGDVPLAKPDVEGILFRCYERHASVEETLEELQGAGARDVDAQMVEGYFRELSCLLEKWFGAYLKP